MKRVQMPGHSAAKVRGAVAVVAIVTVASVSMVLHAQTAPDPLGEKTGGETTVYANGRNAFSFPAANLSEAERTRFVIGNSFFKRNWVEAPASTTARDGLGPHFIARSCGGCHAQDGRGAPPDFRLGLAHDQPIALLMRISVPGVGAHGAPKPDPVYGDQFNNAAIQGVQPEGEVTVRWEPVHGRFSDGTAYTLQKPIYGFRKLAYGPLAKDVMSSPRIAPHLIGSGLLEAIPEAEIVRNAANQAATPGPIKGKPNRVWDAYAEREMLGRFGWKANVATLAHQTAGAFLGDIGITSSRFPNESCSEAQQDCLDVPRRLRTGATSKASAENVARVTSKDRATERPADDAFEIDDETLANVIFYQAVLAPPARRSPSDAQVLRGQKLFAQADCAQCHRPSYTTGAGPFPGLTSKAVQGQTIWPYTDLLLHDMGEALADGRPDFQANGRQWRTPPLWGIGLIKDVNRHTKLLHDGRADGVLEAILWHGGEAQQSKQKVLDMGAADRAALVKFVESL